PEEISSWDNTLAGNDLDCHIWATPEGDDLLGEIDIIAQAANTPGVESLILDVRPFDGRDYWRGSRSDVITFMGGLREEVGYKLHIGLSVDPRGTQYSAIHPEAWRAYVNSLHPQIYWEQMDTDPIQLLTEAYTVWGRYGLPIFPALQGYATSATSIAVAQDVARSVRGATGLSYYRLGAIGPLHFPVINEEFVAEEIGPDNVYRRYGWEQIVTPDDPAFRSGTHSGASVNQLLKKVPSVRGHSYRVAGTRDLNDSVWAHWTPTLPEAGIYEVSVFIPNQGSTTRSAQYHIHGVGEGGSELLVKLNQSLYTDQWVPLVVYEIGRGVRSGRVNLTDLTGEADREVAFSAVRWRQVIEQTPAEALPPRIGFDSPVGTPQERLNSDVWPGDWFDATGYATYYTTIGASYHTGVDLNNNGPYWDADRDAPVHASADGVVTFSGNLQGTWGWVIVIRHDPLPDGSIAWTRYAHLNSPDVREGERVELGQQIARIGNAYGKLAFHLHFDIAKTDILERYPGHWPGLNLGAVYQHYYDPLTFIRENRPPGRG
ncbi:MAG: peptidoglycan DD-metalloendopeptidase family protein, partial [Chloroflexi bacterium]|nr:peptidoglycan DD-metalloendopeptidase family protein [Chloroflexota bacterium]